MLNNKCLGCGIALQHKNSKALGYAENQDQKYCQRCFRLKHYNDVLITMKESFDINTVMAMIKPLPGLILWVVDAFDLEASLLLDPTKYVKDRDILIILTKCDLLTKIITAEKLIRYVKQRLHQANCIVEEIALCGDIRKPAGKKNSQTKVFELVDRYRKNRDVIVMGIANAGKSTLLNCLCDFEQLTTSSHPGTTLEANRIEFDGYAIYDTPGIYKAGAIYLDKKVKDSKKIIPIHPIKPRIFQIYEDQSFALGGLIRLDLETSDSASVVAYFSDQLLIHRGKVEHANKLWQKHYKGLLSPTVDASFSQMQMSEYKNVSQKTDIVVHGLGFFCVKGKFTSIRIFAPTYGTITLRKAMI